MSDQYDWAKVDKEMGEELLARGITDDIEPPTPEQIAEWEREDWYNSYQFAMDEVEHKARLYLGRFCPVCKRDCGEPEYEPADYSVGILSDGVFNECPEHGEFDL